MPKPPDRAMPSRLVDAYDRILEESLGLGDEVRPWDWTS